MELKSRQNPKVKHMKKLAESRKYREECREFFCDGHKLLAEAIEHDIEITCVMACESLDIEAFKISRDILEYISPMKSPQPVVFSCKIPNKTPMRDGRGIIVLESIGDPSNLGAMLRTADAFFMEKIIILEGCADLYNPKTIRATMGAVFRQPVVFMSYDEFEEWLKREKISLFGAALTDRAMKITEVDITKAALAIGSEGSGLSQKLLDMCHQEIIIPMNPGCESLNAAVAASILMWEFYRRER